MLKPGTTQKRLNQPPTTSRASARIAVGEPIHREDAEVKRRRMQNQVSVLQQDNAIADPHADLKWHKALPKFNDEMVYDQGGKAKPLQQGKHLTPLSSASLFEVASKKGKKLRMELTKVRMRKNFAQQLQECEAVPQKNDANAVTYSKCAAPPSRRPPKKFCAVCGFRSKYNCTNTFGSGGWIDINLRCPKWRATAAGRANMEIGDCPHGPLRIDYRPCVPDKFRHLIPEPYHYENTARDDFYDDSMFDSPEVKKAPKYPSSTFCL